MKVLVIDDNAVNRRYVKSLVEGKEIMVLEAENALSGIEMAKRVKPDLILVDIQMPEIDGFECLKILKSLSLEDTPILAITAFSGSQDRDIFIKKGFHDYLTKPVKPDILTNTVNFWLKTAESKSRDSPKHIIKEFDPSIIKDLLNHMDETGLAELFFEFKEETNQFVNQLISLHSSKNYYNICSTLHTIKGNAGSLGFFELSDLADRLEAKTKLGDYASLEKEFRELKAYTERLFDKYETQFKLNP